MWHHVYMSAGTHSSQRLASDTHGTRITYSWELPKPESFYLLSILSRSNPPLKFFIFIICVGV